MKNKIIYFLLAAFVLVGSFGASNVNAQTATTSADVQAKVDLVNKLTTELQQLQNQINTLMAEIKAKQAEQGANIIDLVRTLRQGYSGDDVKILQAILAANTEIYPEGIISGYYGPATARAVARFQAKFGIDSVGFVGPKTLQKLREELAKNPVSTEDDDDQGDDNGRHNKRVCAIIAPGHLIAPGWLRKNGGVRPVVPVCQTLPKGIAKKLDGIFPPVSSDKTAPVISAVVASNVTAASAKVTWTTDENSTSKVYYSTTNNVSNATPTFVSSNTLVKSHTINLSGLTASTVYYFMVESKDLAGNVAYSAAGQFTTMAPDTTAPVISAVTSAEITATAAKINWTTDEDATSKVYYGKTTPISTATALSVSSNDLVKSHTMNLTGLTSGTTYYFMVESKDSSGNTTMGTEQNFTTLVVDTVAPVISAVSASSITTTGASVGWTTNESSNSKVYYSTTTPVNTGTAAVASSNTMETTHSLNLTGLTVNTTYYYVVESKDGSNNTAQSAEQTFKTLADTTAPGITNLSISALTSLGATVNWHTDEHADSKVYYSVTTPVDLATAQNVSSVTLVDDHSISLTGLTANTKYYFIIESKDSSGNKNTTTEQFFVTLQ